MKYVTLVALAATLCTTTIAQRETWQLTPRFDLGLPTGDMANIPVVSTAFGLAVGVTYHADEAMRHAILGDFDLGVLTSDLSEWDPGAYVGLGVGYGYNLTDSESEWIVRPQISLSFASVAWYTSEQVILGEVVTYDADPVTAVFFRPGILAGYQVGRVWLGLQAQYSFGSFDVEYDITTSGNTIVPPISGDIDWSMIQLSPTVVFNL